jgi:8-oxo-dGTP pyrophosphatase MutT (NUDIX family)
MPAGEPWHPHITVATVIERDGRFLLVEERARGELVVNQPAGHLDPGETIVAAAVRETLEETAWRIEVTALIAIYQWTSPDDEHFLRFTFAGEALAHEAGRRLDTGIERALWLTPEELTGGRYTPRSPLVVRSVTDYRAGTRAPLALLASLDH